MWGWGSSPLARGLRWSPGRSRVEDRIIPARAGFTVRPRPPAGRAPDHPRSRGVYAVAAVTRAATAGSSPLARGLREGPPVGRGRRGIIPARAGFTHGRVQALGGERDHPRSRGVYEVIWRDTEAKSGSSPLARGLPRVKIDSHPVGRIIPARAGFTLPPLRRSGRFRDHPRSRGVYWIVPAPQWRCVGSSPLARGLRWSPGRSRVEDRIIPARAGFTR